ncbi:hypothetical protein BJX99DRAFT_260443 [Aspergillus californicus]
MPSTIPLKVAIYDNPGILHWSLFIDVEKTSENTTIQILGARQRYFPEIKTPAEARISNSLIELRTLCAIDVAAIETVKNIAYATPIRNHEADYSCQDFVLDVLNRLEEELIIDKNSVDYKSKRDALKAKRESWQ